MDRITKKLIEDFLNAQEMSSDGESDDFEFFTNYTIFSNDYSKTFDVKFVTVGKGSDTGIDGIGIIVNGNLVEDVDEIDDLLKVNGFLEVTYIFTQSKTSSNFETKDINQFFSGVLDFFSEAPRLSRNDDVKKFSEISEHLLDNAHDLKNKPTCKIYYVTTGVFNSDQNISAVVDTFKENMKNYNLFEEVKIEIFGANEIGNLYRKSKNPISTKFNFVNKISLPETLGIDEAYYGILPFYELKKILIDDNDNLHSIFDDNVRDFQGLNNIVNDSIDKTLKSDNPELFSVLNNGLTIVADSIKTSSNYLTITDYQVVNGCQTSNVLFQNRNNPNLENINIPLRLIVTTDEEVKSKITISTNNQTAVKKEQLTAMSEFQKHLQHYYDAIDGDGKLYYERRAREYSSDRGIVKRKIITIANQIKSFSSMFSKNPHKVTTYLGSLVKTLGEKGSTLFEEDHQFAPYYMSGLAYYRLDTLFTNGKIDKKYKKVRFYILMLVPMIASSSEFPPLNSQRKCEKFCAPIIAKLNNDKLCTEIFVTAVSIIDSSGADVGDKEALKSRNMTDKILQSYNGEKV